jgi:hypothetical protein
MRQRVIPVIVVVMLLLTTVALAQPDRQYAVASGTISGQGYYLTSTSWQVSGLASGGDYYLLQPAAPRLRGSGCCCTYLPITVRNFKP